MQRTATGPTTTTFSRSNTLSTPQVISSDTSQQNNNVLVRSAIALEYSLLRNIQHCPLGMYVLPSSSNIYVWDVVFFIHQGYYADSVFKFRITFPQNFPESPPVVDFVTEVFHPLVSHTGSFNLGYHYKHWRADEHHVIHVLHWIKSSFKKNTLDRIQESDCYNKEAFRLYRESTSSFANLAAQSAQLSSSDSVLFDTDDGHPKPKLKSRSGTSAGTGASGAGSGIGQMGLTFERLDKEELKEERLKLGLKEWTLGP
ncbi:hypothetical protein CVT24_009494 [Panaeolus cyanescens]|uniref:UBC core domain-containing protein n=1 Tax=Panaeolus cyanescens TaxID=181874 RepID=A0A409VAG5_9AGAR|nr:hypothetical protein CVT24_009494 [Panaeolus cyanescens]